MTRNTRVLLANDAERWIRAWSRPDVSREDAAVMVTYWHLYEPTDPELVDEVLARFAPAEPPSVPGLDFLPADACPSMFQDRNEPIYLYPCRRGKDHGGKHYSRDLLHSWTDAEQYDPSLDVAEVEADAAVLVAEVSGGWDDDTSRCARCGSAYSPSYATHCVPCDGPMRVVSGDAEPTPARPNLEDFDFGTYSAPAPSRSVIDESGKVQQWTAVYWRYHVKYTEECDSLQDALDFLNAGEDAGSLSSESILGPDGGVVLNKGELFDASIGEGRFAPERREQTLRELGGVA